MHNPPYDYSTINLGTSIQSPSTVHCKNSYMVSYYARYLFQKMFSVFKWENIPDTWSKDYLLYNLYAFGFLTVLNTDKFGVIPQYCSLSGYNVFLRPTTCIISNPLIRSVKELQIGKNCELIRITPDYQGFIDIISTYADMMGLCMESIAISLINSKNAFIFKASDKNTAESLKKMYDMINSGNPAVAIDKALLNDDGTENWTLFNNAVGSNYITDKLLADLSSIENMFCTEIGIPNANYHKKERMITDEVRANRVDTYSNASLWLEYLNDSLYKVNKMFNLNISVSWAFKEVVNDGGYIDTRNV